MAFTTTIEVAWGDCDAAGIVFYPQFFRFMDTAFQRFLRSRGTGQRHLQETLGVLGTPLLEASANFVSPARYDDMLILAVEIEEIGNKVLRIGYTGRIGERIVFTGQEVRALVGEAEGRLRSLPIPPDLRDRLAG